MRFPANVEAILQEIEIKIRPFESEEDRGFMAELFRSLNRIYDAGKRGEAGYPIDPQKELKSASGIWADNPDMLLVLIDWKNDAYRQGREAAGHAVMETESLGGLEQ